MTNYIQSVSFEDFMQFESLQMNFSRSINVISGENGVGKTNIIKALYSTGKVLHMAEKDQIQSNEKVGELLAEKLVGVYRPDKVGRLVKRKAGRRKGHYKIKFTRNDEVKVSFSDLATKKVEIESVNRTSSMPNFIYIPPKEIISAAENFSSLYEDFHIAFEETYYDLNKLLLRPIKKGRLLEEQKVLIQTIEEIISGKMIFKDNKFYLNSPEMGGSFEMGLVAEGYRKLATILQLIMNGVLNKDTILFWDEPEVNMNPKMIPYLKDLFVALGKLGVQLFITTHSYFLQKELSLFAEYENEGNLGIQFTVLSKEDNVIVQETKPNISELDYNPIQEEFEKLYNREQDLFYDE